MSIEIEEKRCIVIRAVEQRLQNVQQWTQREFARDVKGDRVEWYCPSAVTWCVLGALNCDGDKVNCEVYTIERAIEDCMPAARRDEARRQDKRIVPYWNDHPETTHAEVCAVLAAVRRKLCPEAGNDADD